MKKQEKENFIWQLAYNAILPRGERQQDKALIKKLGMSESAYFYNKKKCTIAIEEKALYIMSHEMTIELRAALHERWRKRVTSGKEISEREWDGIYLILGLNAEAHSPIGGGGEILVNLGEMNDEDIEIKINKRLQGSRQKNSR